MTEPQASEARRKSPLVPLILIFATVLGGGFALRGTIQGWLAPLLGEMTWRPILQSIEASDLPPELAAPIRAELEALEAERTAGQVSQRELYDVGMALSRGLLAKLARLWAVPHHQTILAGEPASGGPASGEPASGELASGEPASGRQRARQELRRLTHGVLAGRLTRRDIRPLYERYRAYGERASQQRLSEEQLVEFAATLQALSDAVGVPAEVPDPRLAEAFRAAIAKARGR